MYGYWRTGGRYAILGKDARCGGRWSFSDVVETVERVLVEIVFVERVFLERVVVKRVFVESSYRVSLRALGCECRREESTW